MPPSSRLNMAKNQNDKSVLAYRVIVTLVIILGVGGFAVVYWSSHRPAPVTAVADPKFSALAECLTGAGAKMYGTSWCPHCKKQKEEFGAAFAKVAYVECADEANPRVQAPACAEAGITGYPTWLFADGSKLEGDQSFAALAKKAGCPWTE